MVRIIECGMIRKRIVGAIKTDFKSFKKMAGEAGEPNLAVLVFDEVPFSKKFVSKKHEFLNKLGFRVEVSYLPRGKSDGTERCNHRLAEGPDRE